MAVSSTSYNAVARRYASAFIDIAGESQSLDHVEKDLAALSSMIEASEDFRTLLHSPLFSRQDQQAGLQALAQKAGFHAATHNLLLLLAQNRRLPALAAVIGAVRSELSKRRGEVDAHVESAFALTPEQTKALQSSLVESLGNNVSLNVSVNKDLIGGMIVTVGSKMIDDSVKRKIDRLGRALQSGKAQSA